MPDVPSAKPPRPGWGFAVGTEIMPGRTVEALLGGGDRTEAYAVWNHPLMRRTVVKVLRPNLVTQAGARRRLSREGELLRRLDHPGLTSFIALDVDHALPFLEIEHAPGPRLSSDVRRHGPLTPHDVAALGRQLAETLAYVHDQGVVHLDVKPGNVILSAVPRLIDFSIARRADRVHRIDGFVGTDAYMSPEQADPDRWSTIGPASDVWGLGATLYYALTGWRPFAKGDRSATGPARFPQLVEPAATLPGGSYGALGRLIMSALSLDPASRPTAAELVHHFEEGGVLLALS